MWAVRSSLSKRGKFKIMKIIHYFLGFPPYRSGGLTKYAFDLMKAQVNDGHEVLHCGQDR